MKRKMKRFSEGDEVVDMRDNPSSSVGEDTRARAMKFLATGKKDEDKEESKPTVRKTSAVAKSDPVKKETAKTEAKDTSDQNTRRSNQSGYEASSNQKRLKEYDKPLESVHPEDYLTPGGALKGLARGASRLIENQTAKEVKKQVADRVEKTAAKEAKDTARRNAEGYSPEEAVRKIDEPARKIRTESSGAMKGTFKPSEIREGFKSGGMARTSASKRADGCATKGFTRACGGGYMGKKK
jgi:hypothetical protein